MDLFIDFKELLAKLLALVNRIQELTQASKSYLSLTDAASARMHNSANLLTWVSCFLTFMAVKSDCQLTRALAAYGQIIINLARKHGGQGWLAYDQLFRQQVAAGSPLKWNDLSASLMAATVIKSGGECCSLCHAADHGSQDCALASSEPMISQHKAPPSTSTRYRGPRPKPYARQDEVCQRFNRGSCAAASCKFAHVCSLCNKAGHGAHECSAKGKGKATEGRSTDSRSAL